MIGSGAWVAHQDFARELPRVLSREANGADHKAVGNYRPGQ